jgi:hypothetical protein
MSPHFPFITLFKMSNLSQLQNYEKKEENI